MVETKDSTKTTRLKFRNPVTSSIRAKLITIVISVTMLSVIIVGAYAVWVASTALQQRVENEEIIRLDSLAQRMSDFLKSLEKDVLYLSQSQTLVQYLAAQADDLDDSLLANRRAALEQDFLAFAQSRGVYDQVRFLDVDGQEIVRVNTSVDGVSTIVPQEKLQNKADRYYFANSIALPAGEIFISPLGLNVQQGKIEILPDGSNKPVIRYGTPVLFRGQVVGVIVTNVLAKNLLDLLNVPDALVYLVDQDGYYLYHPDESKRWGRDLETGVTLFNDYSPEIGQDLLSKDMGVFTAAGNFFAHRPLDLSNTEMTWYLGTVQPQAVVFEPVSNYIFSAGTISLFVLCLALILTVIMGRAITVPIIQLDQAILRIAGGDFEVKITRATQDEVGSLARSFNTMVGQLQTFIATLEQRLAARTQRLEIVAILSERLLAILQVDQLLQALVDQVTESLGYYHAHVYLVDDERKNLVMTAGVGDAGAEMKARGHHIPLDAPTSLVAQAARTGEIVSVDNVLVVEDWLPNPLLPDTHSEMAVPFLLEGNVVGVLDIQQDEIAGLDEGDANLLRSLANQVAVAIRNARLFNEVEMALSEARAAQERYLEQAWQKTKIVARRGQYHYARPDAPALAETTLAEAKQKALSEDQTAIVTLNGNGSNQKSRNQNQKSIVAPITVQNKAIGALQLHPVSQDQVWTEDDLAVVKAVVDELAQIAENLRLLDDTRERASRERLISQISDKLRRAPDLETLMKIGVEELSRVLGPARAFIRLGSERELGTTEVGLTADPNGHESALDQTVAPVVHTAINNVLTSKK